MCCQLNTHQYHLLNMQHYCHYWKTISNPQLNSHRWPSTLPLAFYSPGCVSVPTVCPPPHTHTHTSRNKTWFRSLSTDNKNTFQGHSIYHVHNLYNMFAIVCGYQLYIILCMSVVYSGKEWLSSFVLQWYYPPLPLCSSLLFRLPTCTHEHRLKAVYQSLMS